MTDSLTSSRISQLQRDIERFNRDLSEIAKDEAARSRRVAQVQASITKNTSQTSVSSKLREIQRMQDDIVRLQEKRARATNQMANKTAQLHDQQQKLVRSQARQTSAILESLRQAERARRRQLSEGISTLVAGAASSGSPSLDSKTYDAFISHAFEDKEELVRPLAQALAGRGLSIWYDEFELRVGDRLRASIDRGLANSRFGIVVLSPAFFAKNWTNYELDGLVEKEMAGGKLLLPIWHKVSKNEVLSYSPSLADRIALQTSLSTIEEIADQLKAAIGGP